MKFTVCYSFRGEQHSGILGNYAAGWTFSDDVREEMLFMNLHFEVFAALAISVTNSIAVVFPLYFLQSSK